MSEERGHEERMNERWKESKRESIPTTEQVQIVLTMLQSFEWCGFLAIFFLRSFVRSVVHFLADGCILNARTHTHTHIQ